MSAKNQSKLQASIGGIRNEAFYQLDDIESLDNQKDILISEYNFSGKTDSFSKVK